MSDGAQLTQMQVYTSLLSRLQKTANADVGHELATLKESITGIAKYDYGPRLDALQNAVECFLSSLSSSARRTAQKGTPLLYVGGILPPIADDDVNHARDQNRGRDDEGLVFIKNPKSAQEVITNYVAGVTVTGDKDQDEWIRVEMLHDRMFDSPSLARMWSPRYRRVHGLHAAGFLWEK
ncbi:hypothetical protein TRAPUB_7049 [Trametes pubescens]|uniref:Uncharacterized protein n=1 Tax=Trametes pubescens TaxID=154538 RepID=A0A1M2V4F6_TRAPU|nr:hypothetical protein TRAPUB_7049 [Trametes pubescens]